MLFHSPRAGEEVRRTSESLERKSRVWQVCHHRGSLDTKVRVAWEVPSGKRCLLASPAYTHTCHGFKFALLWLN